jgi:hypothetical protein
VLRIADDDDLLENDLEVEESDDDDDEQMYRQCTSTLPSLGMADESNPRDEYIVFLSIKAILVSTNRFRQRSNEDKHP